MSPKPVFTLQEKYELYWEERKILIDAQREAARTFDKAILTFTSGAFIVSIAFLRDIIPSPYPNTLWLLGCSWLLFALSLIVILFSFIASQNACRLQVDIAYDAIVEDKARHNIWTTITAIGNYVSLGLLAGAFVFSAWFVYWNKIYVN
jgi:hypothetical protein